MEALFEGYEPRECGEHRTVGTHRAWCFECNEWCYSGGDGACKGCRPARLPPGMTPEKLEKVADYVSLLDRMDIDLEGRKVTFGPARTDETEMQDDLRAWAEWLRKAGSR